MEPSSQTKFTRPACGHHQRFARFATYWPNFKAVVDTMSILQTEFNTPPCDYHDGMPCEPCLEIAKIEAQIKNLHSHLKDLRQQHRHARLRRNHVHSPLIHRFPLEIVTEIFINAFPPRDSPCNRKKSVPLILGKVCHTWRDLSFSIPRLWCDIDVDIRKPNLPLLNHQVAHSGMLPLSIRLFTFSLSAPRQAKEAIYFVVKQLHRTGFLCLNMPEIFVNLFDFISELDYPNAAPYLDELHIHSDVSNNFRLSVIEPPRPQKVVLQLTSLNHIVLDWTNITKLKLGGNCLDGLLPTLVASTHLKELNLWLDLYDSDIPTMPAPVVIPSVEFLILGNVEAAEFMFTTTILPSLRTLQTTGYGLFLEPLLSDFLRRSSCPLQVLNISGDCDYKADEREIIVQTLIDVLGNTNRLHQLCLGSFANTFDFEPLLRRLSQDRAFLPCLQTLSMEPKGVFQPRMELFLDVMEARSNAVQPLQELRLAYCGLCYIRKDDVQRIIRLRAAGKMISITFLVEGMLSNTGRAFMDLQNRGVNMFHRESDWFVHSY